jgi:hypothetical protein
MGQLGGRSPEGGDGDDAWTESSAEEELRWRKTGEEDAWAMGTNARRSGVDGRDEWRAGSENFSTDGRRLCFNGKRRGGGPGGVDATWRRSGRERGRGRGALVRCGEGEGGRRVALRQWRTVGSVRRGSTWLTGGPGHYGVRSSAAGCGAGQRGAALTGGVGSTVRPIRFSNRIKFISNRFKLVINFDRSKRCLTML